MARLGIGATFHQAFGALWLHRRIFGFLVLGWLAAEFIFQSGRRYFNSYLLSDAIDWVSSVTTGLSASDWPYLFYLAGEVPHNAYGAVFVVLVMRVLLFETPIGQDELRATLGRAILSIFLFKMSVSLFYVTWQWLVYNVAGGIALPLWRVVFWLVGTGIVSRICFIYPKAAMGRGWQLRQCWRDAAGNAVGLFMLFALVQLPAKAIGGVLEPLALQSVLYAGVEFELWTRAFLNSLERIVASMILLALFAVAFARLTGYPAVGIPGTGRTPEQLAKVFE